MATETFSILTFIANSFISADFPSWYTESNQIANESEEEEEESDSVEIGGFKILNFDVFEKKLANMPGFDGFAPRWTLITRLRNTTNELMNSSSLLLVIVSFLLCIFVYTGL